MKQGNWLVLFLVLSMLVACATSQTSVYGKEFRPWGVERIRANLVWDNNNDTIVDEDANAGQGACIAIIDSGIDYWTDGQGTPHYHPDLANNVWGGCGFLYSSPSSPRLDHEDIRGHGTHVAGIIAAVDNDIGVIGNAPKTHIWVLKAITLDHTEVAAAINYAVTERGIHIISISLGDIHNYTDVYDACKYAYEEKGALIIAAAGNENGPVLYPAAYDFVVAVGAVYPNDTRWEWSNFGPELDFVAPGVDINSTCLDEGYLIASGTSAACPHVSALAALIWSSKIDPDYDIDQDGEWSNVEVEQKLRQLALDLGPAGRDDEYGYGLINAWATNQRPLGDINLDYKVDLKDYYEVCKSYGGKLGEPGWNPRADINIDNKVDLKDIYIVGKHYGEIDP